MSSHSLPLLAGLAALLVVLEGFRRGLAISAEITRRLFYMGVGLAALAAVAWLDDNHSLAAPFIVLSGLMYLSFRYELVTAVEDDGASLGPVLLPLSCALLLTWFPGERAYVAIAAIFAASFGDSMATLVGRRMGTRKYHTLGHARTMEGTLTLFLVAGLTMAPVLIELGGLGSHQAIAFALISATVAASVESVSVYGTDNLTVPVVTAATIATLVRFSQ